MFSYGELLTISIASISVLAATVLLTSRLDIRRLLSRLGELVSRKAAARRAGRLQPQPVPVPPKEKGQALIELALVLPLIFVFIMVIVDFGIALDRREVIQHAVREGARRGAVGVDTANIQAYAIDQSQGTLDAADISVCYVDENGNGNPGNAGDSVRVSANYTYEFTVGGGELLGFWDVPVPTIDMTPSAQARLETSVPGATAC